MRKKKGAPVVIVRKDKKLNKTGHLMAFALTGGVSSVYTATKAATNAGYNARTRKLMEQAEEPDDGDLILGDGPPRRAGDVNEAALVHLTEEARFRALHVPGSKEYKGIHG